MAAMYLVPTASSAGNPCDQESGDARRQCVKAQVAAQTAANRQAAEAEKAKIAAQSAANRQAKANPKP